MIWKTDWKSTDNHAHNGVNDLKRLCENYSTLAVDILAITGNQIKIMPITLNGHLTLPFADLLNKIESNMNAIHIWPGNWITKNVNWQPAEKAPTYEDINRWEQNGKSIYDTATLLGDYNFQLVAGTFCAGDNRTIQTFSRGRF